VQPDLIGLEISKGELRRLTGFDPDDVFRPSVMSDRQLRNSFFIDEMLATLALSVLIVGSIYAFIILPTIGSSIPVAIALLILVPIVVLIGRSLWRRKSCPKD
jgi:hypothetical protein